MPVSSHQFHRSFNGDTSFLKLIGKFVFGGGVLHRRLARVRICLLVCLLLTTRQHLGYLGQHSVTMSFNV
jgi:hypothetical protein